MDRLLGKVFALVLEVNGRGGNQSSIWGCMAAVIWARQSLKKPYWPALVLGIMAPDDQREEWHGVVTARNEARLPEKLRIELQAGKRKAEGDPRGPAEAAVDGRVAGPAVDPGGAPSVSAVES